MSARCIISVTLPDIHFQTSPFNYCIYKNISSANLCTQPHEINGTTLYSIFTTFRFDPDHFSDVNKRKIPKLAWEPFGFAGKRKCVGYRFSQVEIVILLAKLYQKLSTQLVPGQTVEPVHGLVTKPKEEVWITVAKM